MGLREKVALLIFVEFFVQVMDGQCLPNTNKWTTFQIPYKKYKVRKKSIPIQRPIVREGCVARIFNFPEVEYGFAPTPTSSLYSNHNFQLKNQIPKLISTTDNEVPLPISKYSVPSTNDSANRKYKKNRKDSATDGRKTMENTIPKTGPLPNTCLNNDLFFPSVDYPLDVTDLWTPHYWNRFPQMQAEPKLDMTINTKPKKNKSGVTKGSRKKTKENKILNSCTETKTIAKSNLPILNMKNITNTKQNVTESAYNNKNLSESEDILANKERFIPISAIDESLQCGTQSFTIKNESNLIQDGIKSSTDNDNLPCTKSDEFKSPTTSFVTEDQNTNDITEQAIIGQGTPTTNVERPYCIESTSTTSNIVSFLTTVAPTFLDANDNIENSVVSNPKLISSENICNSNEVQNDYEDSQLPDDMGYTVMYPEIFSSVSTSTMSPFDENINSWIYPEFDNHTFNSYSDEVEQCYILVP